MHIHTPFHPFQKHPVTAQTMNFLDLALVLLGIAVVLMLTAYGN